MKKKIIESFVGKTILARDKNKKAVSPDDVVEDPDLDYQIPDDSEDPYDGLDLPNPPKPLRAPSFPGKHPENEMKLIRRALDDLMTKYKGIYSPEDFAQFSGVRDAEICKLLVAIYCELRMIRAKLP